jgi:hypothetical protein
MLLLLIAAPLQASTQLDPVGLRDRLERCRSVSDPTNRAACLDTLVANMLEEVIQRQRPSSSEAAEVPAKWSSLVRNGKEVAKRDLKDPGSAQFRKLLVSDGLVPKLCGEINAKNSYGGYIGFARFIVTEKGEVRVLEGHNIDARSFDRAWAYYCNENVTVIEK